MTPRAHERPRFLRALLDAMGAGTLTGVVALGCGGNVVVDSDGAIGGGGSGGGSSTTTWTTSTTSTSTTTPTSCNDVPGWGEPKQACLPLKGDVCPFETSPSTLAALGKTLGLCVDSFGGECCGQPTAEEILCALPPSGDQCCYVVLVADGVCAGRPFTVAGEARTAPLRRAAWGSREARSQGAIDAVTRRAIAEGWARDAAMEHASIASFARLALELLAVGAPSDLVREAQEAMGDEIRHAELSFALASAFAGAPVGPGPFPVGGAMGRVSLADLAAATVREGCVGETIAAIVVADARDAAIDPAVRSALATIADDEAKHAASAWRLVAWAAKSGGDEVRAAIAQAFDEALAEGIATAPDAIGVDQAAMRAHGRIRAAEIVEIAERAIAEVIAPARAALVAAHAC